MAQDGKAGARCGGHVFVITAPSGTGKTTLVRALIGSDPHLALSISHTSRTPRDGELTARDYHFVSPEAFMEGVNRGDFLEWAEVYGNYYGTTRSEVERILSQGKDALLELDVQGALNVAKLLPEAILIFILPPSLAEGRNRLLSRGSETLSTVNFRVQKAKGEIEKSRQFHYLVINDDLRSAMEALRAIIISARHKNANQCFEPSISTLLNEPIDLDPPN